MPDILHQDKHVQTPTATYHGTPVRIISFSVKQGRKLARIEFADKSQLTVDYDQIQTKEG